MIDDATIKRVAIHCGLPAPYVGQGERDALGEFARAIEQLARAEQREEDARICEGRIGGATKDDEWWNGFRSAMKQCAEAIRAAGKENSND